MNELPQAIDVRPACPWCGAPAHEETGLTIFGIPVVACPEYEGPPPLALMRLREPA